MGMTQRVADTALVRAHEGSETCLLEMTIRAEGFVNFVRTHQLKADTIGEAPFLVCAGAKQADGVVHQARVQGNDFDVRVVSHRLQNVNRCSAVSQPGERGSNLKQHGIAGDELD